MDVAFRDRYGSGGRLGAVPRALVGNQVRRCFLAIFIASAIVRRACLNNALRNVAAARGVEVFNPRRTSWTSRCSAETLVKNQKRGGACLRHPAVSFVRRLSTARSTPPAPRGGR